ncbi:unnamed protein product [Darwinula stevensoni]|uniref:DNA-dependent protein kinase catalytic subunit CC5 domain-containing protein n=1 Tax=Darwinula stevensoni TaxID=69355 RepID=A0A7R9FT03_9CRUS|nr:unnamed protein product [Darwinula stevensoni]CAG0904979.1 unnamed protein product [Darwinula stevensoni]
MKSVEIQELLPLLSGLSSHPSLACRKLLYDLLFWIYNYYRVRETGDECGKGIVLKVKELLLEALEDPEPALQQEILNFWSREEHLSVPTDARTLDLLSKLYSPATESTFLSHATYLLLETSSRSPDYQGPLFREPLSECIFQEYGVDTSWRQRHASLTPLFIGSQEQYHQMEDIIPGQPRVRATQQPQFLQTMTQGEGAFSWVSQSTVVPEAAYERTPETMLLFSLHSTPSSQGTKRKLNSS